MNTAPSTGIRKIWLPLAAFALFAIGLIATGSFLFHAQRAQIRANAAAQLRAVGELRIEQIHDWLNAARSNARHFGHASQMVREFETWLATGGKDQAQAASMLRRMAMIRDSYGHASITLFDRQGMPRLSENPDPHMAEHRERVLQAMASGRALLVDFHQHGDLSEPMLGMVAPMIAGEGGGDRTVGALFYSLPARQTLFSIIQRWPTPSVSGETMLLQRASGGMQILFASRQPEFAGLGPRASLAPSNQLAQRLSQGERSILAGALDFRGQPVLAYGDSIPDTPWILVTKLDQAEVDAPVQRLALGAALVAALLLLAVGLAAWLWWRAQINRQRAQLLSKELERQVLARRSEALLHTRLQLSDLAFTGSLEELLQAAVDAAELFTGSRIGFFHLLDQVQDDSASLPDRKGWPEGHATVLRELVVPILRQDKVVAVLGVGNKAADYLPEDREAVESIASMVMDMVARKRAEDDLKLSNTHLLETQRLARMGDWEYDRLTGRFSLPALAGVFVGNEAETTVPTRLGLQDVRHRILADDLPLFDADMQHALEDAVSFQHEVKVHAVDGATHHLWLRGQAVQDVDGKVTRLVGVVQDISERRQVEARLELATHLATHFDALTKLPNARYLLERLEQTLAAANPGVLALLVLNIDRFAQLNESLGHAAGDQVLIALASRLAQVLPEAMLLARLESDQFALLWRDEAVATWENPDSMRVVVETANRLLASMADPINVEGSPQAILLTLSIGIAVYPGDTEDAAGLLHAAEDAMRNAKVSKGNQVRFFDRRYAESAIDWFETEAALRLALEHDALFLVYQPQVDAASGRVVAAESLIRWRRDGNVVPPGSFIHIVEGTDLAEPVTRWVLRTACRQARLWLDRNHPLRVAVNIFSDHVTSGRLLADVSQALADSGLPAALLELEVIESSLLKNPDIATRTLREIKRLGVGLALDDFGTGYSSLGYLKHYPFDVLKIDQLFTRNVTRDPEDAAIVRSTIALAHNLGMRVLAEGVETEPQLRFMARYGCDQVQGYLTSRPTTPEAVETLVMEWRDLRPAGFAQTLAVPNILIVEDEPIESELLLLMLQSAGFGAQAAVDLDGAILLMGKVRIDLIIADYYLARTTGVEVLAHLRRLFPDIPSIMVSGAEEQAVVVDALNLAGISAFLHKPVDADLLLHSVRSLLEAARRMTHPERR